MKKVVILFLISFIFATNIKKELQKTNYYISRMNKKMDSLAKDIIKKENEIKKLDKKIVNLNLQINLLKNQLINSNQKITELNDLKKGYEKKLQNIQNEITNFLSTNYYINNSEISNINDLINYEITKKLLENYSQKIAKLVKVKENLTKSINNISNQIKTIINKQLLLKKKKQTLLSLVNKRKKEINLLKKKKSYYKKKLLLMIEKQKKLQQKLKELSIIKKEPKKLPTYTSTYKGIKTIAPINGKVIKKFGSYIDPIYKIRVHNDSITIKPYTQNAVVRSIMSGKVVYIGESFKKKIVVIKHKNNIFSIYANLDKVSPLIKKGRYVKRGQIIGRVNDALEFEITYKEKPINPLKVINLR